MKTFKFSKREFLFLFVFFLHSYVLAQSFQTFEPKYRYYYGSIGKNQNTYYQFYVPANKMGVFTLKTRTTGSDFDMYAYSSSYMNTLIEKSSSYGTEPELIIIPVENYGRWIYVKINNDGGYGQYYFYAHHVNISAKFNEALILAIFEGILSSGNDVDDRNLSRGLNLAASFLKNSSLEDMTRSFLINELTSELRRELGYGPIPGFFVNFTVSIFDDITKNVW